MGREARLRTERRSLKQSLKYEPPVRLVPSKRGLVFAFTVTCAWAACIGLLISRCSG